jgi:predicted nucleic acid-binding protein
LIIADTSGLLAYFHDAEFDHERTKAAIDASRDRFVVSPFVLAELDYLVLDRLGVDNELTILNELRSGGYELAQFDEDDIAAAMQVIEKYRDQGVGLTDASIVVLAERHQTKEILTLDHRHFGVLRPLGGGRFKLLPQLRRSAVVS